MINIYKDKTLFICKFLISYIVIYGPHTKLWGEEKLTSFYLI